MNIHCPQFAPGRGEGDSALQHINHLPTDFLRNLLPTPSTLGARLQGAGKKETEGGRGGDTLSQQESVKSSKPGVINETERPSYATERRRRIKTPRKAEYCKVPKIQKVQITGTTDHENYIKVQITQHPPGLKKILKKLKVPLSSKPTQCCGAAESI